MSYIVYQWCTGAAKDSIPSLAPEGILSMGAGNIMIHNFKDTLLALIIEALYYNKIDTVLSMTRHRVRYDIYCANLVRQLYINQGINLCL